MLLLSLKPSYLTFNVFTLRSLFFYLIKIFVPPQDIQKKT